MQAYIQMTGISSVRIKTVQPPINKHARTDHEPSQILVCKQLAIIIILRGIVLWKNGFQKNCDRSPGDGIGPPRGVKGQDPLWGSGGQCLMRLLNLLW